jgi:hypothetical protein
LDGLPLSGVTRLRVSPDLQIEAAGRWCGQIGGLSANRVSQMKRKLTLMAGQYRAAPRKHLKQEAGINTMKKAFQLLALLVAGLFGAQAAQGSTNSAATNRILLIDPSSMPVAKGKATLTIGALQWTNGVYSGDYKINVTPYFFKSEKGRLAIIVSDESFAKLTQGKVAAIIGTATTNGKGGKSRHIDATAAPFDVSNGTLKLWFTAGIRKMIFEPAYHFAEKRDVAAAGQPAAENVAAK